MGIAAILIDLTLRPASEVPERPSPGASRPEALTQQPSAQAMRWLLAAFFVSGLTSLAYQVIWTRILAIFFEATTYAFNLILCTFLLGLATGSYLIATVINRGQLAPDRARWSWPSP